jgi:hypothetical protein
MARPRHSHSILEEQTSARDRRPEIRSIISVMRHVGFPGPQAVSLSMRDSRLGHSARMVQCTEVTYWGSKASRAEGSYPLTSFL